MMDDITTAIVSNIITAIDTERTDVIVSVLAELSSKFQLLEIFHT